MRCCGHAGNCVVLQSRFEDPEDVHGIIMRGPEALQSQFATGYGMVLNLLHSRSLAEARAFIQRSFSNYLGALLLPAFWSSFTLAVHSCVLLLFLMPLQTNAGTADVLLHLGGC